eukprot:TRINITY_DN3273_c1_g1_i1.p1 TRINITY_DN3273_c1_g1~~TRINITY_DN3273_c1_g1_i1.p1  ORF type:complete len:1118 (-),score=262.66 TRINITY_DN3273_c1_g1_i1:18-3371(-)
MQPVSFAMHAPPGVSSQEIPNHLLLRTYEVQQLLKVLAHLKSIGVPPEDQQYRAILKLVKAQSVLKTENNKAQQKETITQQLNAYKQNTQARVQTPVTHVPSLTLEFVTKDYEQRKKERVTERIAVLEDLLVKLPADSPLRVKVEIEKRTLELLPLQQLLKHSLTNSAAQLMSLQATRDPLAYKRSPFVQKCEVFVPTEKTEWKQQEDAYSKRRKLSLAVIARHDRFRARQEEHRAKWESIKSNLLETHAQREKKKAVVFQKREKERLAALKNDDEEAYMKLLADSKNERLSHLLEQTDSYLTQIGVLVHQQQREREREKEASGQKVSKPQKGDSADTSSKNYYSNVHRIVEKVTEQPKILVGGSLKPYQMRGLEWMVSLYNNHLNGILADEMGLGKTIQTISLLAYLYEKGNRGPFLIITPLSTISNWAGELEKWTPSLVKVVYKGSPAVRKKIYQQSIQSGKFNVLLTTYEYIMKDKAFLSKRMWKYVIIDEGHRMKNHSCKLAVILQKHYKSQHRLILTGTPLQNNLQELWAILNFLLPTIFNSVETFEQWFNAPFATTLEKVEMNEEEKLLVIKRLHKVLRPFLLRRMKTDVEDQLPPKVEKVLHCDMSALQKKMYHNMRTRGIMTISSFDGKVGQKGLMNTLMQLRKLCNHPYLFNLNNEWNVDDNLWRSAGKFELLDRILPKLKATGHRILIFSQMTSTMDVMEDYFKMKEHVYLRLDGSTKADERGDLLAKFNAPDSKYFIFLLSTRAGGLGLNLQTADTVILFDSDWNPMMDLQAQDRAHRIGSRSEVRVFRFVTVKSVEEDILERANFKLDMDQKIIEAGMFNANSNANDRNTFLLKLLREDVDEEADSEVPDDEEINKLIARGEEEFDIFQKMDIEREEQALLKWRAEGNTGDPPPRLMTEEELPEHLQIDIGAEMEKEDSRLISSYGRGQRKRTDVSYNCEEEMGDEEWMTRVEQGGVVPGQVERPKKRAKTSGGMQLDDDIRDNIVVNQTPTQLINTYTEIWNRIQNSKDYSVVMGRARSLLFMELPDPAYYDDYYKFIKQPISMNMIKEKISSYQHPKEFYDDFALLFSNAKRYNSEASQVHQDAAFLENLFKSEFKNVFVQKA